MRLAMNTGKPSLAVKAVVVDLDGTLLDTAADLAAAANGMLGRLGLPERDPGLIRTFIGKGMANLVRRCLTGKHDLSAEPDAELLARAMPLYEEIYARVMHDNTRPYPGVIEGLRTLQDAGLRMACVTNKSEKFALPLLTAAGLRKFFELVICGDTLPRRKPDPLPLRHACARFGVRPEEMVLIGDSRNDVEAARAAGCRVLCVPYGYNEGAAVQELDSDGIVDSLLEASSLLAKVSP